MYLEHRIYPVAPWTDYSQYALFLERGALLYPEHATAHDLFLFSNGTCSVCAHGALVAGMNPTNFQTLIGQHSLPHSFAQFSSKDMQELSGYSHPLLWNRTVHCPCFQSPCQFSEENIITDWGVTTDPSTVDSMIIHLFDGHLWDMEMVASWLRSLD